MQSMLKPIVRLAAVLFPAVVLTAKALSTERLLAAAEAMATAAEQYTAILIERGLPADFVVQLRGAAEGIRHAVDEGRKLILSLSVLVARRLRGNDVAPAECNQLKRVTLQGSRSIKDTSAGPSSAAPEAVETAKAA